MKLFLRRLNKNDQILRREVTSMATRGRKPKPTALKILEGNPGQATAQRK